VWVQLVGFAVGVWLTASPDVLGSTGPARVTANVLGPLAAMFALIATFEVTRPVRWLNLLVGVWLVFAPWGYGYPPAEVVNSTAAGLALAATALVRGRRTESFGGGWRVLWDPGAARG
jgi:hypothetical protein